MPEEKYDGKIVDVVTDKRWMDNPHRKLSEPCPKCGGSVRESEPEVSVVRPDFVRLEINWRCTACHDLLGVILLEKND